MHLLSVIGAALAEEHEKSKVPFFVMGGLLAGWAVVLAGFGLTRSDFPGTATLQRAVMGVSAVLVAGAMAASVISA